VTTVRKVRMLRYSYCFSLTKQVHFYILRQPLETFSKRFKQVQDIPQLLMSNVFCTFLRSSRSYRKRRFIKSAVLMQFLTQLKISIEHYCLLSVTPSKILQFTGHWPMRHGSTFVGQQVMHPMSQGVSRNKKML